MRVSPVWNLLVISLMFSCAHSSDRNPASLWERGNPNGNNPQNVPQNNTRNNPQNNNTNKKTKKSKDTDHSTGLIFEDDRENEEARGGCGAASLARIDMGNGFSASDILTRISNEGTFSGRARIPTWRAGPAAYGYSPQYHVDYAASVEYDRETLRQWLDGSAPDSQNSDVFEAARDSQAFSYAVNFVNGNGAVRVYSNQYDVGHRIAALMAVMFAAAKGGDVDCVSYIEREWVKKLLPDAEIQKLFNSFKADRDLALTDIKEGRLDQTFRGVYDNRQRLHAEIRSLDQVMSEKEKRNQAELKRIQASLKEGYSHLRTELREIPPCRNNVDFHETIYAGTSSARAFPQDLVEKCHERLNEKLDQIRDSQLRLESEINITKDRMETAQAAMERALEKGNESEVARRQEAIVKYEEKIIKLTQQIDIAGVEAEKYTEYLALITESESSSVTMELNRINELLTEQQQRAGSEYMRPEQEALNRLQGDLKNNSTHYLSLGFMGGFDSVGMASISGSR